MDAFRTVSLQMLATLSSTVMVLGAGARLSLKQSGVDSNAEACLRSRRSAADFFEQLHGYNPGDAFHDFFVLGGFFQVVFTLQPHPEFRCSAKQAGDLHAHYRR